MNVSIVLVISQQKRKRTATRKIRLRENQSLSMLEVALEFALKRGTHASFLPCSFVVQNLHGEDAPCQSGYPGALMSVQIQSQDWLLSCEAWDGKARNIATRLPTLSGSMSVELQLMPMSRMYKVVCSRLLTGRCVGLLLIAEMMRYCGAGTSRRILSVGRIRETRSRSSQSRTKSW